MNLPDFNEKMNNAYIEIQKKNQASCVIVNKFLGYNAYSAYRKFIIKAFNNDVANDGISIYTFGKYTYELNQKESDAVQFLRLTCIALFWEQSVKNKQYVGF